MIKFISLLIVRDDCLFCRVMCCNVILIKIISVIGICHQVPIVRGRECSIGYYDFLLDHSVEKDYYVHILLIN